MISPTVPTNEFERLRAVKSYGILDTPGENQFDDITKLAAQITETPISLISLLDKDREWFKSHYGIARSEAPRDLSFCGHAINSAKSLVVEDARLDPRFHDNPFVINEPNVIFYAGTPLINSEGFAVGTICVIDNKPRKIDDNGIRNLEILAKLIMNLMEQTKKRNQLAAEVDNSNLYHKTPAMLYSIDVEGKITKVSDHWLSIMGYEREEVLGRKSIEFLTEDSRKKALEEVLPHFFKIGEVKNIEYQFVKKSGEIVDVLLSANSEKDPENKVIRSIAVSVDISDLKRMQEKLQIMQFAIDTSSDIVFWIRSDGSFYNINQAASELWGYTKAEILSMKVFDVDPNYTKENWQSHWEELKANKTMTFLSSNIAKNGTLIQTEVNANHVIFKGQEFNCGFVRDITERKKIEEEKEYERLEKEAIINSTTDLIWSIDMEYKLIVANQAFVNTIFKNSGRLLSKKESVLVEIYPPELLKFWKSKYDEALTGVALKFEFYTPKTDHEPHSWFEINLNPIYKDKQIVGISAFGKNTTDKKEAEELLNRKNEMLHFMDENSKDGFAVFEGDSTVFISKSLKRMLKLDNDNNTLHSLFPLIDPRDRRKIMEDVIEKGRKHKIKAHFYSYRIQLDNETKWLEDSLQRIYDRKGNHIRTIINTRDITERKLAEQALIHTKEMLEDINRVARIGNWEYDLQNKTGYISPIAKDILELEPDFTTDLDSAFVFFKEGEFKNKMLRALMKAVEFGAPFDIELPAFTAQGKEIWLRSFGKAEFDNQICVRIYGAIQDITVRKNEEREALELLRITSIQNTRLQNFAYIISHNVRSHSANFTSLLNLIDEADNEVERTVFTNLLRPCANNLEDTIQNLNEIITIQSNLNLEKSEINLKDEIAKTMQNLTAILEKTETVVDIDLPNQLTLHVIPAYLESILLNLFTNAIKYRLPDNPPQISISHQKNLQFTTLIFSDKGLGIDLKKFGNKIFGMYKTFHGNADAKGIGLFITKEQIEAMNGKIEVESEVNKGTTFKVYFRNK